MSFLLSHHYPEEHHRTVVLGGVRLCARCLFTYPTLLLALTVQLSRRAPLEWRYDGVWAVALLLPALGDWAFGRFRPRAGSNAWRGLTGVLLGLALGRALYVHLQRPLPLWLLVQGALVTGVAVPVILATYRGRRPP